MTVDLDVRALAESFIDDMLAHLHQTLKARMVARRDVIVDRLAGAMQEAIEQERAAIQRDVETGFLIADAIIGVEARQ